MTAGKKRSKGLLPVRPKKWRRILVPGLLFQSVLVGGGYGTGAEIARYFGRYGLAGGLLGMGAAAALWCLLCAVTFEFARRFRTWDYGSLMRALLGPLGVWYDAVCFFMTLLVLGVVDATAGVMAETLLGLPPWTGAALVAGCTVWLVLRGTEAVESVLSAWSYVLYAVYLLFLLAVFSRFGGAVEAELARGEMAAGWLFSGLRYAAYNLVMVPLVLYALRDAESRREAVVCGILAGLLAILPGVLLLLAMGCDLAAVTAAEIPVAVIFDKLDRRWLYVLFEIVLFGTLIETGTGFIKAVADRAEAASGRQTVRVLVTAGLAVAGLAVSAVGLGDLIEGGYGAAGYVFFVLYALPMLTVGVRKIKRHDRHGGRPPTERSGRHPKKLVIFKRFRPTSTLVKRRRLW